MEILTFPKKVSLKKVRTAFLNKRPENTENENDQNICKSFLPIPIALIVDPRNISIPKGDSQLLHPSLGLVETNRKLTGGYGLLNHFHKVANINIQDHLRIKSVTLSLQKDPNCFMKPWQYTVNRLESYGDLEFSVLANKIRNHHETYKVTMERYFSIFKLQNYELIDQLKRMQRMAISMREEIERKTLFFFKATAFANKDSVDTLSLTYTDGFLGMLGFTIDSFSDLAKEIGIPSLVHKNNPVVSFYTSFMELAFAWNKLEYFREFPERPRLMVQKDGTKIKILIKSTAVIEPNAEGIFIYMYHFIRRENLSPESPMKAYRTEDINAKEKVEE